MEQPDQSEAYRFGDFLVDSRAFRVFHGPRALHLEPKAVDVLLYLLRRPGELVPKHELIDAVWKGTAVTDNALTRVVAQLRHALADSADAPRYIETVPTRGYRFIAVPSPIDARGGPAAWPAARAIVAVLVLLTAVAVVAVARRVMNVGAAVTHATVAPAAIRSVAVLPLKNLSGDASQDYVADGMTEALTERMSRLPGVTVMSFTSSNRYRSSAMTSVQIASELGVDALLEGSVVRSGEHVHVTTALVDGATGRRIWSDAYDRTTADVLSLYADIASGATRELAIAVTRTGTDDSASPRRVNPQAYDDYLRGMYFLGNRWMAGGCSAAERSLVRAIAVDPTFAAAYGALSWCYAYPDRLGRNIAEIGPKAKAAVERALALDDRLALAHAVAGTIKWRIDYDAAGGGAELQRALELDPNSALVLIPAAEFFLWRGEPGRAYPLLDRALTLDPFSPDRNVQIGFALLTVGRYDQAIADFRRALELDPNYLTAQLWLAEAYAYHGERDTAVAEYLRWLDGVLRPDRAPSARAALADAYARSGWIGFWRREAELAEEEAAHPGAVWIAPYSRYTGPWFMARRYARLGERDRALDALEHSYTARHHLMATLTIDPLLGSLRSAPRFRDLQRRTGAPPAS